MKCLDFKKNDSLIAYYHITVGKVYFFENYYVLEIDEGVDFGFNNSKDLRKLVNKHYADGRPFGVIANRINSYSIDVSQIYKFKTTFLNPVANAVVYYNEKAIKFFTLENYFCYINRKKFTSFRSAEKWILNEVNLKKKTQSA